MAEKILVVEDERNIASFVAMYLKNARYQVDIARDGAEALQKADSLKPDLVVLDLMLPDIDGLEVCRQIRSTSDVPILMLTARDDDVDKIVGLEVGADDYLTKPFNPRELVARIKSILRRSSQTARSSRPQEAAMEHGQLRIDAGRREVTVSGRAGAAGAEGVRPAVGAARPSRAGADPRPAARAGLGIHLRRGHPHGGRARAPAAAQARR